MDGEPVATTSLPFCKKSSKLDEGRAGLDDSKETDPRGQTKLGLPQSTPLAQVCGRRLFCSLKVDKVGAATLTHATPSAKARTRAEEMIVILLFAMILALSFQLEVRMSR